MGGSLSPDQPSYADREFDRFFGVCVPIPDGSGFYDASSTDAEALCLRRSSSLARLLPTNRHAPAGWSVDGWRKHLLHMADSCERMHAKESSKYRGKAEALEIAT